MTQAELTMLKRIEAGKRVVRQSKTLRRLEMWGYIVAWPGEPVRLSKSGRSALKERKTTP